MSDARRPVRREASARTEAAVKPALVALLAIALLAAWLWRGPPLALLLLAAGALALAIGALWRSVRTLLGEAPLEPEDAYALAVTAAEDEQKLAVLRALDDLELERQLGKIAPDEAGRESDRYRRQARALLGGGSVEATWRSRAEALLATQLAADGDAPDLAPTELSTEVPLVAATAASAAPNDAGNTQGEPGAVRQECRQCRTLNDPDASFCKSCGKRLGARRARTGKRATARQERGS